MRREDGFNRAFPRAARSSALARRQVVETARQWLYGEDLADFESAVGEALSNAVHHGEGATLKIWCFLDGDAVVAEIEVSGPGFEAPMITQPVGGPMRGYGLFLMHRLMDEVHLLDQGRCVRLVKCLRDCRRSNGKAR